MVHFFGSKALVGLTSAALGLLLLSAFSLYLNADQLPEKLVLHFTVARGVDFFGTIGDVWGYIALGAGMVAMNAALGAAFFQRERAVTYLLAGVNLFLAILIVVGVASIISAN